MSVKSWLFGESSKAKRLKPLEMTAEESFLMNYLMNMYMNKGSGPMGQYTRAMTNIMGTKGVPINYNGRQVVSIKPTQQMQTMGTLAQELLKNQIDPAQKMWSDMMNVRYGGTAAPASSTPGWINTVSGAAVEAAPGIIKAIG